MSDTESTSTATPAKRQSGCCNGNRPEEHPPKAERSAQEQERAVVPEQPGHKSDKQHGSGCCGGGKTKR